MLAHMAFTLAVVGLGGAWMNYQLILFSYFVRRKNFMKVIANIRSVPSHQPFKQYSVFCPIKRVRCGKNISIMEISYWLFGLKKNFPNTSTVLQGIHSTKFQLAISFYNCVRKVKLW